MVLALRPNSSTWLAAGTVGPTGPEIADVVGTEAALVGARSRVGRATGSSVTRNVPRGRKARGCSRRLRSPSPIALTTKASGTFRRSYRDPELSRSGHDLPTIGTKGPLWISDPFTSPVERHDRYSSVRGESRGAAHQLGAKGGHPGQP